MIPVIRSVTINQDNKHRFQSFILFEPASSRLTDIDILYRGDKVKELHEHIMDNIQRNQDIKSQILKNKLLKVGQMLELLSQYDNVIMTKFFDRIWRRYGYVSNIGEHFLDLPNFELFFPDLSQPTDQLMALRLDEEEEDDIDVGTKKVSGKLGDDEDEEEDPDLGGDTDVEPGEPEPL